MHTNIRMREHHIVRRNVIPVLHSYHRSEQQTSVTQCRQDAPKANYAANIFVRIGFLFQQIQLIFSREIFIFHNLLESQ